jgi:hypothetical protein
MKFIGCICNSNVHDISQSEKWGNTITREYNETKI